MSVITLTTDFGVGSPYIASIKGVILSINPAVTIVDITHDIPSQDIRAGAIVLDDVTSRFPGGTIHVAVIDPGVGTDRKILYAKIGQQCYVLPDNGLLSRLMRQAPPERVICLNNSEYWLPDVSQTFHGRDIMAPVAAHLSLGIDPKLLGDSIDKIDLDDLEWPDVNITSRRIEGEVIEIDSFGNLITNIKSPMLTGKPTDERVCVVCSIYETWGIFSAYANRPRGTFIALVDSANRLELAVVGDSAAERLGIEVGMPVIVAWE